MLLILYNNIMLLSVYQNGATTDFYYVSVDQLHEINAQGLYLYQIYSLGYNKCKQTKFEYQDKREGKGVWEQA